MPVNTNLIQDLEKDVQLLRRIRVVPSSFNCWFAESGGPIYYLKLGSGRLNVEDHKIIIGPPTVNGPGPIDDLACTVANNEQFVFAVSQENLCFCAPALGNQLNWVRFNTGRYFTMGVNRVAVCENHGNVFLTVAGWLSPNAYGTDKKHGIYWCQVDPSGTITSVNLVYNFDANSVKDCRALSCAFNSAGPHICATLSLYSGKVDLFEATGVLALPPLNGYLWSCEPDVIPNIPHSGNVQTGVLDRVTCVPVASTLHVFVSAASGVFETTMEPNTAWMPLNAAGLNIPQQSYPLPGPKASVDPRPFAIRGGEHLYMAYVGPSNSHILCSEIDYASHTGQWSNPTDVSALAINAGVTLLGRQITALSTYVQPEYITVSPSP